MSICHWCGFSTPEQAQGLSHRKVSVVLLPLHHHPPFAFCICACMHVCVCAHKFREIHKLWRLCAFAWCMHECPVHDTCCTFCTQLRRTSHLTHQGYCYWYGVSEVYTVWSCLSFQCALNMLYFRLTALFWRWVPFCPFVLKVSTNLYPTDVLCHAYGLLLSSWWTDALSHSDVSHCVCLWAVDKWSSMYSAFAVHGKHKSDHHGSLYSNPCDQINIYRCSLTSWLP